MRLLLKLSGEALASDESAIDLALVARLVTEIKAFVTAGGQLGIVLGGGNLLRGASLAKQGVDRITADQMGMLATIMNGLAFRDALRQHDVPAKLFTAAGVSGVAPEYSREAAIQALNSGEVVIFSGGTGNPLFTTDTAACLRAIEIGAAGVLKATKVDGVYTADPFKDASAQRFTNLTFQDVLDRELEVMDLTAICLCRDFDMPVTVFDMHLTGALTRIANGDNVGTVVHSGQGT